MKLKLPTAPAKLASILIVCFQLFWGIPIDDCIASCSTAGSYPTNFGMELVESHSLFSSPRHNLRYFQKLVTQAPLADPINFIQSPDTPINTFISQKRLVQTCDAFRAPVILRA
jgi:hypothetical protein